jgi:hypothetical protein
MMTGKTPELGALIRKWSFIEQETSRSAQRREADPAFGYIEMNTSPD